jgi:DNA-directed RNA polymerase subunit RPC12/RpoP
MPVVKCSDCQKNFPMESLRPVADGIVKGSHGMKKNNMKCNDCARKLPIDHMMGKHNV